jgi:hypothetical protein
MAIKVVQNVNRVTASVGVAITSNPISLKSGYLRVSTGLTSVYVEVGSNPVATTNSFQITPYGSEVLKERIARQRIVGITTGTSTVVTFDNNVGNPFLVGDYASIENVTTSGINTEHKLVTAIDDSSLTLDYNTESIAGPINANGANIARSVKVSVIAAFDTQDVSITEVVQLVTE